MPFTAPEMLDQSVDEAEATTEHVVQLSGLVPYTRYYYSVGSPADTLAGGDAEHTFRTSPVPGSSTNMRIWVLGDAGRADGGQAAVRDAYYGWTGTRTPDLCLMLGDNAYYSGTDPEYQAAVFDVYPAFLRKMPLWSCLGNHETDQSTDPLANFPYFDLFTFPMAGECGGVASGTEHYYSFDYGNIHFISLDSMTNDRAPGATMATWLQGDLASTTKTWIIAFFHHPSYTKGSHDSDFETVLIEMRENFGPILEAGGVDLVLSGHSHCYERSFLIDGHYGDSTTFAASHVKQPGDGRPATDGAYRKPRTGPRDHFGAVYTVTGSAGAATGGALDQPAMYVSYNTLGSFNLDFDGDRLDATYLEADGSVTDVFTILKQGAADTDGDRIPDEYEIAYDLNRYDAGDVLLDHDGDEVSNLVEFAFGMAANVSDNAALAVAGAALVQRGMPSTHVETLPASVRYTVRFVRRKDWAAAGLAYTVQFSADLETWENGAGPITIVAEDATHEVASVPYPYFVNDGRKARFYRGAITLP